MVKLSRALHNQKTLATRKNLCSLKPTQWLIQRLNGQLGRAAVAGTSFELCQVLPKQLRPAWEKGPWHWNQLEASRIPKVYSLETSWNLYLCIHACSERRKAREKRHIRFPTSSIFAFQPSVAPRNVPKSSQLVDLTILAAPQRYCPPPWLGRGRSNTTSAGADHPTPFPLPQCSAPRLQFCSASRTVGHSPWHHNSVGRNPCCSKHARHFPIEPLDPHRGLLEASPHIAGSPEAPVHTDLHEESGPMAEGPGPRFRPSQGYRPPAEPAHCQTPTDNPKMPRVPSQSKADHPSGTAFPHGSQLAKCTPKLKQQALVKKAMEEFRCWSANHVQ